MNHSRNSVPRLVTYLATHPTLDRLAQFLSLDLFSDHDSHATLINGFDDHGQCRVIGTFGLPDDVVSALQHLSIWDRSPAVDAIRRGEPLVFLDAETVRWHYPLLARHSEILHPTMAWPLRQGAERVGAIHMQFESPLNEHALTALFRDIAPVVALYLSLTSNVRQPSNGHGNPRTRAEHSRNGALTERQLTITRLLAKGMTNPEIAARIGFSDSTVRQETMAIYRHLGANGRREAARIASLRGLLTEEMPRAEALTICH
jgi:DNA-binding CsgD family transcriptional regulator